MAAIGMKAYDPDQKYPVKMRDVEYWQGGGSTLLARVYQPESPGPFPALVDVHGGIWSNADRTQNQLLDEHLASTGMVVVALDFRLGPDHPYPAQIQDVNYGFRWVKAHAGELGALPEPIGGLGTSSGGHTLMLAAMRPRDPRYTALPLADAPDVEAKVAYALVLWAVLDPYARYFYARQAGMQNVVKFTEGYFRNEETMQEGNPQLILERGEKVDLPPTLIIQPLPDDLIPREIPERFMETYRAAGGTIEREWFPAAPHGFARTPSAETDQALNIMKAFIARQLAGVPA